jgi:hypothetical protein
LLNIEKLPAVRSPTCEVNPCSTSTSGSDGSTVTLLAPGICTLRASQAGNDAFTAAPDLERSFHVLTLRVFGDGFE